MSVIKKHNRLSLQPQNAGKSSFWRKESGAVALEFALVLPVLILIAFPFIDFARFILLEQKVVKASFSIADAIALSSSVVSGETTAEDVNSDGTYLTPDRIEKICDSAEVLLTPYASPYRIEILNISRATGELEVRWMAAYEGQSTGNASGSGGGAGNFAVVDTPIFLPDLKEGMRYGENMTQVTFIAQFKRITPIIPSLGIDFLTDGPIKFTSIFPSRNGDLSNVWVD